ncbi:MAG: DUF402 domain-containing protein [Lachnospiraceae bacterium]|nr:DUF402 domain-containing protein [Lachnospiraceae bacterium]
MVYPKLIRKRLIPFESVHLKDDRIVHLEDGLIVTHWDVLKPRKDFQKGISCYFLEEGYKISRFMDKDGNLVYFYCDIIETEYDNKEDTYTFTDLLADVIIYPDGRVKVVDIGEIALAMEEGIIDDVLVKKALTRLDKLLEIIYTPDGLKNAVGKYMDTER